ncbi:MAG TPA: calcium/sodium antiporter [Methanolinea sp.]|jgi:cation:H+ antiporter|nr:MAG: putative membrane protein [Methanoregulaceae archaeon PtaU1.Bin066]HNQ29245.1 calcium/sodium antiporter [Methanolinea sp.]
MIIPLILFSAGLVLLLKGADLTVEGAEGIASRLGISATFIGLTVVAFGTSLPELVVTSEAFRAGNFGIGTGNIIGSNISNIALILGLYAVLAPPAFRVHLSRQRFMLHTALMLSATVAFALLCWRSVLDLLSGIVMLALFAALVVILWRSGHVMERAAEKDSPYSLLFTIGGLAAVIIGAHLLLTGAVEIAALFAIPPVVIGLSMVAVGTSLPELATTVVAAYRNRPGIAIGNIIGSNIFNLLFVMGINALFIPIPPPEMVTIGPLLLFSMAILPLFSGKMTVTRAWGALLVGGYLVYILSLYWVF